MLYALGKSFLLRIHLVFSLHIFAFRYPAECDLHWKRQRSLNLDNVSTAYLAVTEIIASHVRVQTMFVVVVTI